jgi:hypothetical protein
LRRGSVTDGFSAIICPQSRAIVATPTGFQQGCDQVQRRKPDRKNALANRRHRALMPDRIDPIAAANGPIQSRASEFSTRGPTFGSIFVANSPPTQLTLALGRTTSKL